MRIPPSLGFWRVSALMAVLFCTLTALAQYGSNVQGVITDPSEAVAGASVQLRNVDTGIELSTTTGSSGNYRFSSLPPGNYVLAAEATGFRKTEAHFFTLNASETKGINLSLQLAAAQQAVTVEVPPAD